jgi:transcriptional regulator with XRE-family HTH domain
MPGPSKARSEKAHAIDHLVGQQLRKRRLELGLTQLSVAEAERGSNRIVASRLYDLANTLNVPLEYFFAEAQEDTPPGAQADETADDSTPTPKETRDPALRKKLIELVRSVSASKS